jgi:hypothetical protein
MSTPAREATPSDPMANLVADPLIGPRWPDDGLADRSRSTGDCLRSQLDPAVAANPVTAPVPESRRSFGRCSSRCRKRLASPSRASRAWPWLGHCCPMRFERVVPAPARRSRATHTGSCSWRRGCQLPPTPSTAPRRDAPACPLRTIQHSPRRSNRSPPPGSLVERTRVVGVGPSRLRIATSRRAAG